MAEIAGAVEKANSERVFIQSQYNDLLGKYNDAMLEIKQLNEERKLARKKVQDILNKIN